MRCGRFTRNELTFLRITVLGAVVLRLLLMMHFASYDIRHNFDFGYEAGSIARSIATGAGFSSPFREPSGPTAWLMPVYPYFMAGVFHLWGIYTTQAALIILAVNCVVSALTCVPVFSIGKTIFGPPTGYIAAVALALDPSSVWYAINTIWDTSILTFLAMVLLAWLLVLPHRLTYQKAILYGVFMGFVVLVNPVVIAFYPFLLLWVFLQMPDTFGTTKKLATMTIMGLAAGMTLMPWMVRNHLVLGRVMLRSNFGVELRLLNNLESWQALASPQGEVHSLDTTPSFHSWPQRHPSNNHTEFLRYKQLGEVHYTDQCLHETMAFIKEHPAKFLSLSLRRMYIFWFGDVGGQNDWKGNLALSFSLATLKKLRSMGMVLFMLIGIGLACKRAHAVAVPLAFLVLLPLVYYMTNVASRYRFPIEPVILLFASYGLYTLLQRTRLCGRQTLQKLS